nr:winged helix-turn-helix transcriptional regulator [Clostridium puniceum]
MYGELKRSLGIITYKMVSAQLKELDAYNLIVRKEYPQVPPRVKYFLSQRVLIIMLVLRCLYEWCYNHIDDL